MEDTHWEVWRYIRIWLAGSQSAASLIRPHFLAVWPTGGLRPFSFHRPVQTSAKGFVRGRSITKPRTGSGLVRSGLPSITFLLAVDFQLRGLRPRTTASCHQLWTQHHPHSQFHISSVSWKCSHFWPQKSHPFWYLIMLPLTNIYTYAVLPSLTAGCEGPELILCREKGPWKSNLSTSSVSLPSRSLQKNNNSEETDTWNGCACQNEEEEVKANISFVLFISEYFILQQWSGRTAEIVIDG